RELARVVLDELVTRYFDKHLEVHRSLGAFAFVHEQTEKVRAQLAQTEEQLRSLKANAGVLSLDENMASINARKSKAMEELLVSEAELSAQQARVREMESSMG